MKIKTFITLIFITISSNSLFAQHHNSFNFNGVWGDADYSPKLYSVPSFLSIEKLESNSYFLLWSRLDYIQKIYRGQGILVEPNKIKIKFNEQIWTIEGISDYENGKLVYEGLIMYVDPNSEGVIGFDRVETIDPDYLVSEAER